MKEKLKMMQENITRKLDKKREEIVRQKETAATDAEGAAREAHFGKEELDAFVEYEWTPMAKAGVATTEGNPDLPFTGASADYLETAKHFTSQKSFWQPKILKEFGGTLLAQFIKICLHYARAARGDGKIVERTNSMYDLSKNGCTLLAC